MLPIDVITVGEDRGMVVRRGRVHLEAGTHQLRIDAVAPVAVDKTVHARVEKGKARVVDAHVERQRRSVIAEDAATERDKLRKDYDALSDEIARQELEQHKLLNEQSLLDQTACATLSDLTADAAAGTLPPNPIESLQALEVREEHIAQALVRIEERVREQRETLDRLGNRLRATSQPCSSHHAALIVTLHVDEPGDVQLAVDYVVPNACWRPAHTAVLESGRVRVTTDGCVWQNTGEDWDDVTLRLSTQRPSMGTRVPLLDNDLLSVQRRAEVLSVEVREEAVQQTGLGSADRPRVPGIDDGGEVRVLQSEHRVRVPSDGRPHRVRVGSFESEAKQDLVCFAELQPAVIVRSRQTNTGATPLLAGPVDLVRGGGFVGTTTLPFLAPGETFELGWGPDPGVRVRRLCEQVQEDPSMWSGWLARKHRVQLHLGALDDNARTIAVTERIAISEIKKVQVAQLLDQTTGKAQADESGFVHWDVALGPHGRETLQLAYVIKRHADVAGM